MSIGKYHVYSYNHIDDLNYIVKAEDALDKAKINKDLPSVKEHFRKKGWEGDGQIGLMWIPPLVSESAGTSGFFAWHVKQENNGTSFIASPISLRYLEPIGDCN